MRLILLGLGPATLDLLPPKNLKVLKAHKKLYFRTARHPIVKELNEQGISFKAFDHLYQRGQTFEKVYDEIVDIILNKLKESDEPIVYAVPGHPLVAERTAAILLEKAKEAKIPTDVLAAPSGLEAVYTALERDPCRGLIILDALGFEQEVLGLGVPILFTQVYNKLVASDLKLLLMEYLPDDLPVTVVSAAGSDSQKIVTVPIYQLDRLELIDHLTTLYLNPPKQKAPCVDAALQNLVEVMDKLRSPGGCPWDREQNHQSLKKYLLEETYEVLDAIEQGDMNKLADELGDLLLQVVFHAHLAREKGFFDLNDVINHLIEKLKRRHPHIFGNLKADTVDEVKMHWERVKSKETGNKLLLQNIPKILPALLRADKIQNKASSVGFDWADLKGPAQKLQEELLEFKEALEAKDEVRMAEELGDLLFSIVNVSRFLKIDPEGALQKSNEKFIHRFSYMEKAVMDKKLTWEELNQDNLDILWEEAKRNL